MLSHVDENNMPSMVDVSGKELTRRAARARGVVNVGAELMALVQGGEIESKKGPVFSTAIIAGTLGVKRCPELVPFCHPLLLEKIRIDVRPLDGLRLEVLCEVSCTGRTGVEMEALTGVHVALLTIHDMCKALNPHVAVEEIYVQKKTGGKNDFER